jgi:hypothetical protein
LIAQLGPQIITQFNRNKCPQDPPSFLSPLPGKNQEEWFSYFQSYIDTERIKTCPCLSQPDHFSLEKKGA